MSTSDLITQLSTQLAFCLSKDRHRLTRQLDALRRNKKAAPSAFDTLRHRIDSSCAHYEKRRASIPTLAFPDLPVTAKKETIAQLIQQHQVVILCGETGSGKTTQLPKICLELGRGAAGFIGHTQPRRIAARTVADRIAEEVGEPIGKSVGYKVRFNDKTHTNSLVKLMTDGILLAESQNDPFLSQYDTLIIDEAHERSLNIDFLLGYLKWLLPKRPDLKLIVTSATIDTQRFSAHFNNAPIIEVSGRTYPVDVRYRPIEVKDDEQEDETTDDLQQAILDAVDELYRDLRGDLLIFLSGEHEIRETTASLKKHHPTQYEILPLYSKLSVSEQERVFKPKGGKIRIVLATNVAETSLTVPNIRGVIDTGHARISRYSPRSKIQRLPIERISQSSANQRAGRCGRVAEGVCIRLYSHEDFQARPLFTEPEIMRTNLSAVILQMSALNLGDIADFPFIEPPDDKMIRDGKTSLLEVNALDKQGKLTDIGKQLAKLPTDPKLARMLIAAQDQVCLKEVSVIVAALSIQDPREKPADKMQQAEAKHAVFKHPESDFLSLLNLWIAFEAQKKKLSNNKLRKYCTDHFLSYMRMREWHDNHTQILQVIKGDLKMHPNENDASYDQIHRALLTGLLSNIGFRHEQYEYLGGRGLKFFIFPGSGLHKLRPKWIVAAEQVETSKVYARTVARVEPEWIEDCAGHLVKHNYYDPHWEKKSARAMVSSRTLLHGLTLQAGRKLPYDHVDMKAAREIFIRSALVDHDYHSNAPFYVANQTLLEEVGMIQHKGRRVDLVEDEQWLYAFYDHKLPADIVSGVTLDTWRKKIEREDKTFLFLTKEDLTREKGDAFVNEWDFPDHKKVGKLTVALQYRFEPGHDEDGVTAIIPVHQLNQVTQTPFDWLVPGMLEEKCVALVKSLPKNLRKHFVPVPEMVKRCLDIEPDFKGALEEWLGMRLRKLTDEAIALTAWNVDALPVHLKMNFRVIDEEGQLLDYGRDLKALQAKHVTKAGESFDQIAADELNFTGYIQWGFEDLPVQYSFMQKGQAFVGFPALVDEGDSVGVKIFDTERKATVQHQAGLIRLFQLQQRKECTYALKNRPKNAALELAYNRLPAHSLCPVQGAMDFNDDMLSLVLRGVFVEANTIRTQAAFEQSLRENKTALISAMNTTATLVFDIVNLYTELKALLQKWNPNDTLAKSIHEQLDYLIYAGFLRELPFAQLKHLPRYLKAMHYRLEKRDNAPTKVNALARFQIRYWKSVEQRSKKEIIIPEQESFRWLLEEFAVSLFAQHLKTATPISLQRLEKAWAS